MWLNYQKKSVLTLQNYNNILSSVENYNISWFGQKTTRQINGQTVTVRKTEGYKIPLSG